jgi:hypothetical protein
MRTARQAGRPRAAAACPPGALWRLCGTSQPPEQGVDEPEASPVSPRWSWALLRKRVFALALARCPWGQRGALRLIAASTHGELIRTILRYLQLSAAPLLLHRPGSARKPSRGPPPDRA